MEIWIARDSDGYSQLYVKKPIKEKGYFERVPNTATFTISCLLFLQVTFENSPQKNKIRNS